MLMKVDYVRDITVKKFCKYGEFGLFYHLHFFLTLDVSVTCAELQL